MNFGKSFALSAAILGLGLGLATVTLDTASAQYRHGGVRAGAAHVAPGRMAGPARVGRGYRHHGGRGAGIAAGIAGAAILGGILAAQSAPGPAYVEGPDCYIARERVWDDYRGRWVSVKRRVCE